MYNFETILVVLALIIKNHPDKKDRKKRFLAVRKRATPGGRAFIEQELLNAVNFKTCIDEASTRYLNALKASREAVRLGAQGMLIHGDEAIPVYLDIDNTHARQQCIDNEDAIISMVGREYMYKYNIPHGTLVTIGLFNTAGFTGQDRTVTLYENKRLYA